MRNTLSVFALIVVAACGDNVHQNHTDGGGVDGPSDASHDASVDAGPCVSTAVLDSLATGTLTLDSTQAVNLAALDVPLDKSILFVSLSEREPSPQYGGVLCELQAADVTMGTMAGVACSRNNAGTDTGLGTISIRWTVATFSAGVAVQRGEAQTYLANPSTIGLAVPADPSSSFVLLGGIVNAGTGWGNNEFARARLVDANTLDIRTQVAGTSVAWQVVTMSGAAVQRGTVAFSSSDTQHTASISASARPLLLSSYTTDNASGIAAATLMLQASSSGTQLMLQRDSSGSALDVSWELITLPFDATQVTTGFATTEVTKDVTVPNLPAATSVAIATSHAVLGESTGSTDYAGADLDVPGESAASLTVSAANTVTLVRATGESNASISWTAIDFSQNKCHP